VQVKQIKSIRIGQHEIPEKKLEVIDQVLASPVALLYI